MSKAILTKVNNKVQTHAKLPQWTQDSPDKIIKDVENGTPRVITQIDCEKCKSDLEENNGAEIKVVP
jgi:hypothetical protein